MNSLLWGLLLLAAFSATRAEASQCGFIHGSAGLENTCGVRADGVLQCWGEQYPGPYPAALPVGRFTKVALTLTGDGACALRRDGTAACWGNLSGGAGAPPGVAFTEIVVEYEHGCGLRADGSIQCWGASAPSQAPAGTFTQVAAGYGYSCGLKADSTVECWGTGSVATPPQGAFTSISGGYDIACGIRPDATVECWGDYAWNPPGEFSTIDVSVNGGCGLSSDGSVACWGLAPLSTVIAGQFEQVWDGGNHVCALRADGTVQCRGDSSSGRATPPATWQRIVLSFAGSGCGLDASGVWNCWGELRSPDVDDLVDVSVGGNPASGDDYGCGLRSDGTAYCWGADSIESYGTAPPGQFLQVVAGGLQACGLRPDGSADCWGTNTYGAASDRAGPFTQIAAGQTFNCGLLVGGTIECWGQQGANGQLTVPPGTYTSVATGKNHACAIRSDETVVCWGGFVGLPFVAPPPDTFSSISAGNILTCGIRTDGSAACWGKSHVGEGPPDGQFVSVAAATGYACGVRPDGDLVCWGNYYPIAPTDDCVVCGDGILEPIEGCDDGNTTSNDGCSDVCEKDCTAAPLADCRTGGRSQILIRTNEEDPARSKMKWKWRKGEATSIPELSDPRADGVYNVCLYPDGALTETMPVPVGEAWTRPNGNKYRYRDKSLELGPTTSLEIKAGTDSKASVSWKAAGEGLPPELLPATSYVAQLVDAGTGICWSSSFPVATTKPGLFKARSSE